MSCREEQITYNNNNNNLLFNHTLLNLNRNSKVRAVSTYAMQRNITCHAERNRWLMSNWLESCCWPRSICPLIGRQKLDQSSQTLLFHPRLGSLQAWDKKWRREDIYLKKNLWTDDGRLQKVLKFVKCFSYWPSFEKIMNIHYTSSSSLSSW